MSFLQVFLVLYLAQATRSQLRWIELKPNSSAPSARSDSSIGFDATSDKVVIFGGRGKAGSLGDTWLFDLSSKNWSMVEETVQGDGKSIPEARFSMVFGFKDKNFYITTGEFSGGGQKIFYNDVVKFDMTSQKWQRIEPKSSLKPETRYGSGGGIHPSGDGLYVTHGFAQIRYSDTLKFDLKNEKWETKFEGTNSYNPSYPHARCLHSSAMTGPDEFIMFGGCLGGGGTGGPCPSEDGWKYNAAKNTWTLLSQCATPRMYSAMAMLPSRDPNIRRAVLYGGREKTGSVLYTAEAPSNEIIIFDPDTDKWSRKKIEGEVPIKRFGHVMTTTPYGIIMFGGVGADGKTLNDLWLLEGNVTDADQTPSLGECDSFTFNLIMLHGIIMFIGWGVLLQLGAFVARYYRHKDPWWFNMHRGLQIAGLLFAIGGLVCGVLSVPFGHFKFAHSIIGLVVMIVGVLQPVNAFFRPHKFPDGSRSIKRVIWEWYHKLAGRAALILALINISLGVFLAVMPTAAWAFWFGYLGLLCLLYLVMEVKLRMNKSKTGTSDLAMEKK